MRIGIIGTGYVGLVTGACFAEFGIQVTCADKDEAKIRALKKGAIPFYEPGLPELVEKNVSKGRLKFTTRISDAVESSSVIFIAVGTPPRGDGSADLRYVEAVSEEIAGHMDGYKVVVTKSTVPVGTGKRIKKIISRNLKKSVEFDIASNPEFLREGSAIEDFMRPNRVVIGAETERAVSVLKDLYKPLYLIETPFVISDMETAEIIKHASNCFLATKISFINEMANLCEEVGADVHKVAKGMGLDGRIGPKFLHPGPGFGGSCLPKDVRALISIAGHHRVDMKILKAVVEVNERQKKMVLKKLRGALGPLGGKTIAVLGLSFKPNTDDMRDAPSIDIIEGLAGKKAKIRAYDPVAMKNAKAVLPKSVYFARSPYEAVKGAHALLIVTEWNELRNLDLEKIRRLMKGPYFFDLRNVYEPERMGPQGFKYFSVGRPRGGPQKGL